MSEKTITTLPIVITIPSLFPIWIIKIVIKFIKPYAKEVLFTIHPNGYLIMERTDV